MKIKLVFLDAQDISKPYYKNQESHLELCHHELLMKLTTGDFHSGSTFDANIFLDEEQENQLKDFLDNNLNPIFYIPKII